MPKNPREKTSYPGVYFIEIEGDKRYYISYRKNGKRIEEKVGTKKLDKMKASKASAIRSERMKSGSLSNKEMRGKALEEKAKQENRWTFDRLWQHYQENRENYKGGSRERTTYAKHIQPFCGQIEPQELDPLELDRFRLTLLKKHGLSLQTVKNILELIRRLSNWGKKRGVTPGLSFYLEMPKPNNEVNEALPKPLIQSLLKELETTRNQYDAPLIKMLLFTGRRLGEICGLKWSDVDLGQQSMFLRDTKTNQDEYLPIADDLVIMLRELPRLSDIWVFPNHIGGQRRRLEKKGVKVIRDAGIPEHFRSTYCLRHTFASTAGAVIDKQYVIKELMGHKTGSRDITARYMNVSLNAMLTAVNKIVREMKQPDKGPKVIPINIKSETEPK